MNHLNFKPAYLGLLAGAALALSACGSASPSTYADAERAFERGQYRIANAHIADLVTQGKSDDRLTLLQLKLMLELGDGDSAITAIEKLPESVLGGPERRIATAHAHILRGFAYQAAEIYDPLEAEQYTEQDFRMALWALKVMGEEAEFATGMDIALDLYPQSAHLNALAGEQLFDLGLAEEALEFNDAAFDADPEVYEVILLNGRTAIFEEDLEAALVHYTRASELYPHRPVPLANRVGLLLDMGNVDAAGETLGAALKQFPGFAMLQWQSARYELAKGNVYEARGAMERARRSFADNPEFVLLSGQIEEAAGNRALAAAAYRRFLDETGSNDEVEALLAGVQE